jgi:hypothetical protein
MPGFTSRIDLKPTDRYECQAHSLKEVGQINLDESILTQCKVGIIRWNIIKVYRFPFDSDPVVKPA